MEVAENDHIVIIIKEFLSQFEFLAEPSDSGLVFTKELIFFERRVGIDQFIQIVNIFVLLGIEIIL